MYAYAGAQHLLPQSSQHLIFQSSEKAFAPKLFCSSYFSSSSLQEGRQLRVRGGKLDDTLWQVRGSVSDEGEIGDDCTRSLESSRGDSWERREPPILGGTGYHDREEGIASSFPTSSSDLGESEGARNSYWRDSTSAPGDHSEFMTDFKNERGPFSHGRDGSSGGREVGPGGGRGKVSASQEYTRELRNMPGKHNARTFRHPRERQWPPPNPRKMYPSNLRYAPNPVYPKKVPFSPEKQGLSSNTRYPNDQKSIWRRDQDGRNPIHNDSGVDQESSDNEERPGKETYLRRLLNARFSKSDSSKSYIREPASEIRVEEKSIGSPPFLRRRRSVVSEGPVPDINMSDDEKALREALKKRRQQTREVLREHFMEASLSKTYSQLVVDNMPAFVDHILIQAVALKSQERYATSTFVARARACLAETKVAEIVRWMKHNHITVPRVGQLVDLKGVDLDSLRDRINFLKKNYVRGRDLGVVLTRFPVILDKPLKQLENMVQLLEDAGLRRDWVGVVLSRSPGVLALSIDELLDKISFFQELGVTPEHFGPMAFNFPASVGRFSLAEMQAKVEYMRRLGMADANIGKAIATRPQLLASNIENGWVPLIKYFKLLGIQDAGILRIFCVHPSVFCMNLERNIAPKVRFFRAIGVHEDGIGQVLVAFPALLSYSLDKKIRPVVRFILEEAGVKEEHIGKVIALRPQLIGTSLTLRLQPLVKFLRNHQLKREHIGHMVADFPMLLRYNLVIIESKLRYFKRSMKRPLEDLVLFPRYFSYSLEERIKPRQQILKSHGLVFHLRYMLACNDEIFDDRVKTALERRALGISSDEDILQEVDKDEEAIQESATTEAYVHRKTSMWGAIRGDSADDQNMSNFEAPIAMVEERLEFEEDAAGYERSAEGLSSRWRMENDGHPLNAFSEDEDDEWFPEDGDLANESDIDEDGNERSGEDKDINLGEDDEFLMKYCV